MVARAENNETLIPGVSCRLNCLPMRTIVTLSRLARTDGAVGLRGASRAGALLVGTQKRVPGAITISCTFLTDRSRNQMLGYEGQVTQSPACRREQGIGDGGGDGDHGCLTSAGRRQLGAIAEHDLDLWEVTEPGHPVLGQRWFGSRSSGEWVSIEERTTESHHRRTFDLADHGVGVDHGAAFIGGDDPGDRDPTVRLHLRLSTGGHAAALLQTHRQALAPASSNLVWHVAVRPTEALDSSSQHLGKPGV